MSTSAKTGSVPASNRLQGDLFEDLKALCRTTAFSRSLTNVEILCAIASSRCGEAFEEHPDGPKQSLTKAERETLQHIQSQSQLLSPANAPERLPLSPASASPFASTPTPKEQDETLGTASPAESAPDQNLDQRLFSQVTKHIRHSEGNEDLHRALINHFMFSKGRRSSTSGGRKGKRRRSITSRPPLQFSESNEIAMLVESSLQSRSSLPLLLAAKFMMVLREANTTPERLLFGTAGGGGGWKSAAVLKSIQTVANTRTVHPDELRVQIREMISQEQRAKLSAVMHMVDLAGGGSTSAVVDACRRAYTCTKADWEALLGDNNQESLQPLGPSPHYPPPNFTPTTTDALIHPPLLSRSHRVCAGWVFPPLAPF